MISRYPSPTSSNKLEITEIKGIITETVDRRVDNHHHFIGGIPDDMGVIERAIHGHFSYLLKPEAGLFGEIRRRDRAGIDRVGNINHDLVFAGHLCTEDCIRGTQLCIGFHDEPVHLPGPAVHFIGAGPEITVIVIARIGGGICTYIRLVQDILKAEHDILSSREPHLVGGGDREFIIPLGGQAERRLISGFQPNVGAPDLKEGGIRPGKRQREGVKRIAVRDNRLVYSSAHIRGRKCRIRRVRRDDRRDIPFNRDGHISGGG